MKYFFRGFLLVLFFVSQGFSQSRIVQSINTNWGFYKGDVKEMPSQSDDKTTWQKINLPHSCNAADVTDDEPGYYRGIGWYKKTIYIPPAWQNKKLYLYFEGAYQTAEVYVNGKLAGKHAGGYTAFSCPVNALLKTGADSLMANEVLVKVDNSLNINIPPLSGDFTFFGGIYRDVYLIATNPVHFDMDSYASTALQVKTPLVSNSKAELLIEGTIVNNAAQKQNLSLITEISDAKGIIIKTLKTNMNVGAGAKATFAQTQNLLFPHLWSPDDPYLYHVVSRIYDNKTNTLLDESSSPLGFRWFSFDADKGFFLNGQSLKLIGANRHQDYKGLANALPNALHEQDMLLLKNMGANFIRISHYPQDPAVLEACDRLGILASEEIPIVNQITESAAFTENCLQMQTEMIRQNFNHPSVIIWAYMNEVLHNPKFEKGSERQKTYFTNIVTLAKQIEALTAKEDPSRYTMIPFNADYNLYNNIGLNKVPSIVGWNIYNGWYFGGFEGFEHFLDERHKDSPDKPLIVTEYGADADYRIHNLNPERFDKSLEYQVKFHEHYFNEIIKRPFVAGAALWCLVDFNSEDRKESTPHINAKGITTDERVPKDAYYFYKANLSKQPFVKIATDLWKTSSGIAGIAQECKQPMSIYSNLPMIKVWLDGKLLDSGLTHNGMVVFNVPFKNGLNKLKTTANAGGKLQEDFTTIDFKMLPAVLNDPEMPFTELNVSLGDRRYFIDDKLKQVWLPEQPYTKGSWGYIGGDFFKMDNTSRMSFGSNKDIYGTANDAVYETQRIGLDAFKADVPDGNYEITLHFAELQATYNNDLPMGTPKRIFDVLINGQTVISHLDNNNYLLPQRAYAVTFKITVQQHQGITVSFKPITGLAILNAVQVKKVY